jgi:hypothetical protein
MIGPVQPVRRTICRKLLAPGISTIASFEQPLVGLAPVDIPVDRRRIPGMDNSLKR